MAQVKNHYNRVRQELAIDSPMPTHSLIEPLVIVPLDNWTRITQKGLRFA